MSITRRASSQPERSARSRTGSVRIVRLGTTSPLFGAGHDGSAAFEELRALSVSGPADRIAGAVVVITFDARISSVTGDQTSVQVGASSHEVPVHSSRGSRTGELRLQLPHLARTDRDVQVDVTIPLRRTATCKFGEGAEIADFVGTNLGGGTAETSEWRYPDLVSDADGYLLGADSLQGVPFAETYARWMVSRPDPMQRLAAFLQARFTRSDMSLRTAIESNIGSLWTAWYWANIPRKEFQEGQPDPTPEQLVEFKRACALELLRKAGLPTN